MVLLCFGSPSKLTLAYKEAEEEEARFAELGKAGRPFGLAPRPH